MNRNFKLTFLTTMLAGTLAAQTVVPDGTPIKLRLGESLHSGRNVAGQGVSLTVSEDVVVNGQVVIEAGARATGTVTMAQKRGMMGHSGKLDFQPDKVQLEDGRMIPLRATPQSYQGKGKGVTSGVLTAGIAIAFWPAAPFALMMKGKDVEVPAGLVFTSFTDAKFTHGTKPAEGKVAAASTAPASTPATNFAPASFSPAPPPPPVEVAPGAPATASTATAILVVDADMEAADVELDGKFVGQTPASLKIPAGSHRMVVRAGNAAWERTIEVTAGSSVSLRATLASRNLKSAAIQ